jgi:hypothetical protein
MKHRVVGAAGAVLLSLWIATMVGCGGSSSSNNGGGGGQTASIGSFTAGSTTIQAGASVSLTAVFSGGTGVITPGNLPVTSGTAVSVSPSATTTYTLTVTPSSGTAATATVTVTVVPVPTITSFTANPTTIAAGGSSSLTAVFAGGTGVITPGNLAVTSGTPVSVTPTATTTYTLTVTPPAGGAITQTAIVTVVPVPTITSFTASPTTITAGSSSSLTAVFTGGTGVINPGNLPVTSGTPVSVSPTVTTTYTLTVTPTTGTAVTAPVTVTVTGPTITSFAANPTTIGAGSSSSLTAIFTGGTGVITPGNLSVTSGTPVSVNPSATTTYTLTVTPSSGTAATATVTVTVVPAPTITSFTANPNLIAPGSSSKLTAVFSGGTGVVTPGNFPITSGSPVTVIPSATTTYTLTVTPTTGTAVTATAVVTVSSSASITSFTANPTTIAPGASSSLTAVFEGGIAVINPGNLTVTSGTPISVSPTTTTTYTLTVTPPTGTAVTQTLVVSIQSAVTVDESSIGPQLSDQLLGMNLAVWYDDIANKSAIITAFQGAGIAALRWPGGSTSDDYHWNGTNPNPANGVAPTPSTCQGAYQNSNTNYLNFINDLELANTTLSGGFDVALTADYGTNPTCTGGGDPNEAANWVKYAYANGGTVSHITVGNEIYGSWEADLHAKPHDAATYAAAVTGTNGYYSLIKAQSSSTLVGVDVDADGQAGGWDQTVLTNAKGSYDFVEYHYYPQQPGAESDTFLVQQAAQELTKNINTIKQELATAGEPNTPIYVGEIGSVSSNPGKQSISITQGLYAGQALGEMMNGGISRVTWWIGFGNCNGTAGNNSSSLYGWQTFGAYNIFSDGTQDPTCPNYGPIGTLSPTAQAFNLFQYVAENGDSALTASVNGDTTNVRAYAATHSGGGTALMLFNLNETTSAPVTVSLSGVSSSSDVTVITYSKAIYDLTQTNVWNGPASVDMGAQSLPLSLTLAPWSMNVVIVKP